ncbi:hypothetical protein ACSBR2_013110 [Camellia fascicularis]
MFCNDPTSARQSMCFHLDPEISRSLAFVQFPQIFYNTMWQGMDGFKGPACSGTGYYLKRKTLFGSPNHKDVFLNEPKSNFGLSSKFIASLKGINEQEANGIGLLLDIVSEEARNLASCTFENGTKWGKEANRLFL